MKKPVTILFSALGPESQNLLHLRSAIEAWLLQSFSGFDLLLLARREDELVQRVLHEFANESRVRILATESDSKAWLKVLAKNFITTDFCCFAGSGELVLPHRLEEQLACLVENPLAIASVSGVAIIDDNDHIVAEPSYPSDNAEMRRQLKQKRAPFALSTLLFRTQLLNFFSESSEWQNWHMPQALRAYKILCAGEVAFCRKILVLQRESRRDLESPVHANLARAQEEAEWDRLICEFKS